MNDKMDEVLLVKGWKKSGTWSFPRGKINKDEDDLDCAIREAWEETGFDLNAAGLVPERKNIKPLEKTIRQQNMKLFVFRNVPMDYSFMPQTRKEISKIQWFRLSDLPAEPRRKNQPEGSGVHLVVNANKFYVVAPFMHDLKKFIRDERKKDNRQSFKRAAAPVAADPMLAAEQDYATATGHLALPLSPPVPSSLPEVTPASAQDPLLHLKQQLNIPPPSQSPSMDTKARSNDLLSLLRKGPAEMRNDPVTPMEQTTFPTQPRSPMLPHPESHLHDMLNMQSPQPSFDLHPQSHPTAPPSSALPQLSQHTKSLLDAFSKPNAPPSPSVAAAEQLPASKQSLLAAFTSQPKSTPQAIPSPADNAANGLLAMLQRKKDPAHITESSAAKRAEVQEPHTPIPTKASPPVPVQPDGRPAALGPFDPVTLVQRQTSLRPAPAAQNSTSWATVASSTKLSPQPIEVLSAQQLIRPDQSPIPAPSKSTAQSQQDIVQSPPSAAQLPRSWASVATNSKQFPHTTKVEPVKKVQPEPAELSATSDHAMNPPLADKTKANLLSLLGSMPSKAPKSAEPKSRSGTTAANLDRPFDEPDFDTVARATGFDDEMKREPITSDRKLFDHKYGEAKQPPAAHRVMSRHDDRNRVPKSPRTARQKQSNTSRPVTPKETQKPFQPQILKRPQTSEGEAPSGLPSLLAQSSAAQRQLATPSTMPPLTVPADVPRSSGIDVPQAVTAAEITSFFSPATKSPIPQDPSRAALLDLLRPPTQQPSKADPDTTPKQSSAGFAPAYQNPFDGIVSPPSASQLVSPVLDDHHDMHAPRSRVSSLASTAASNVGTRSHPEKRQTAAGDKAFLMSYLKNFAGAGQEA